MADPPPPRLSRRSRLAAAWRSDTAFRVAVLVLAALLMLMLLLYSQS